MFNQFTFDKIADAMVDITAEMQETLINKIAMSLGKGKTLSDDDWRLSLLGQRNVLTRDLTGVVADYTKLQQKEVDRITGEVVKMAIEDADKRFKQASMMPSTPQKLFVEHNQGVMTVVAQKLNNEFAKGSMTMLVNAALDYTKIINKTIAVKTSGAITRNEALKQTLTEWAKQGIPTLIDKGGKKWQPDVYARMVIRTNSNVLAQEAQKARATDYGYDLIITSQHADQSNEHAPFANKVYSLSGNDPKYPPFSEATSAGFMNRPNCRHTYDFYFPKVSSKPETLKDTKENYALSQQQRKIERQLREAKREYNALVSAGLDADKSNVLKLNKEMRSFIDSSGRTRQRDREQI